MIVILAYFFNMGRVSAVTHIDEVYHFNMELDSIWGRFFGTNSQYYAKIDPENTPDELPAPEWQRFQTYFYKLPTLQIGVNSYNHILNSHLRNELSHLTIPDDLEAEESDRQLRSGTLSNSFYDKEWHIIYQPPIRTFTYSHSTTEDKVIATPIIINYAFVLGKESAVMIMSTILTESYQYDVPQFIKAAQSVRFDNGYSFRSYQDHPLYRFFYYYGLDKHNIWVYKWLGVFILLLLSYILVRLMVTRLIASLRKAK